MNRVISILTLLTLCISCMFFMASCEKSDENSDVTDSLWDTTDSEESSSPFDIVSFSEKAEWKADIEECLYAVIKNDNSEGKESCGAFLIDADLDAVPEVGLVFIDKTTGEVTYKIYDLKTHEWLCDIPTGKYGTNALGELSLYVDIETNRYTYVGRGDKVSGDKIKREVYSVTRENGVFYHKVLFCEEYLSLDDNTKASFFIGQSEASAKEYFDRYENYFEKLISVEKTDVVCIGWSDDMDVCEMAEALINSTQVFIKAGNIE